MAVRRQGTFGAENHSITRLDLFGGQTTPPVIADIAKTGAHAYQHQGSAFGRTFTATAVRSVCALRHGGAQTVGRLPIVTIGVGYAPLSIMWEPEIGALQLMGWLRGRRHSLSLPYRRSATRSFRSIPNYMENRRHRRQNRRCSRLRLLLPGRAKAAHMDRRHAHLRNGKRRSIQHHHGRSTGSETNMMSHSLTNTGRSESGGQTHSSTTSLSTA
jgi:hypothetical protein